MMQGAAVAETAAAAPQPLQSAAQAADQLPVPQAAAAEAQPRPAAAPFVVPKVPCYQGTCQVPGCGKDLSCEAPYYQRRSFCQQHVTAPAVSFGGVPCRFCQQCAKFQRLSDFKDANRSCRSALMKRHTGRAKPHTPNKAAKNGTHSAAAAAAAKAECQL
ncbi:hypothetical protein OEZ86_013129 [Tetradesmus obliquus]|nr:hypothetical protein OEZ86_013129 [Tetradesmus obliquus]